MPITILKSVFLALVQSVIQYGIIDWGGISNSILTPLAQLHKRIIKICLRRSIDYPTHHVYKEINVFNIKQIYTYTLLTYYHKNHNKYKSSDHGYTTRRYAISIPLTEPKCKTEAGLRHSASCGPRLYNTFVKEYPYLKLLNMKEFKKETHELIFKSVV